MRDYTPEQWHTDMIEHILNVPRCAIWAPMGSGKTAATETAANALLMAGLSEPALVLGPKRVAQRVWTSEVTRWTHLQNLSVTAITGSREERTRALRHGGDIHTCNYENLPWLVEQHGKRWPYKIVVADEASRLKNYRGSVQTKKDGSEFIRSGGSQRARALAKLAHTDIDHFIQLTGTPAPNGLKDLWGQMWFLDAGKRLGRTYSGFMERWFKPNYDGYGVVPLSHAEKEIHDALRDLCLTIRLPWMPLPRFNNVTVDLPANARRHYNEMEKEMFTQIAEHEIEAFGAAARTQKCLQLANGAAYIGSPDDPGERKWEEVHDAKLEALDSCIEEAGGNAVIIAYEFKSDAARILRRYPGAVRLDTSKGFDAFCEGKATIGIAHPASLGEGTDGLQHPCHRMVFFGHNWRLDLYDQMIGRIGPARQRAGGYDRPTLVTNIYAADTVDELVAARRETKREVQDLLLEAMERKRR